MNSNTNNSASNYLSNLLSMRERLASIEKKAPVRSHANSDSHANHQHTTIYNSTGKTPQKPMTTPKKTKPRRKRSVAPLPDLSPVLDRNNNSGSASNVNSPTRQAAASASASASARKNKSKKSSKRSPSKTLANFNISSSVNTTSGTETGAYASASASVRTDTTGTGSRSSRKKQKRPNPGMSGTSTSKRVGSRKTKNQNKRNITHVPTQVDFQTMLRIRPLNEDEEGEEMLLNVSNAADDEHENEHEREYQHQHQNEMQNKTMSTCTVHLKQLKAKASATPKYSRYQDRTSVESALAANENNSTTLKYHFDRIIGSNSNQEETYQLVNGQTMAKDVLESMVMSATTSMAVKSKGDSNSNLEHGAESEGVGMGIEAKNHVVISMGVSNSGKTFTLVGGDDDDDDDDDQHSGNEGILPRLIDDLFRNGESVVLDHRNNAEIRNGRDRGKNVEFQLEMSMVHIHNNKIFDMLSLREEEKHSGQDPHARGTSTRTQGSRVSNISKMIDTFEVSSSRPSMNSVGSNCMQEIRISQDKETQDFVVKPTVTRCISVSEAREVLNKGMEQNTVSSTKFNRQSSRGHTLISLRPVLRRIFDEGGFGNEECKDAPVCIGASITIIDMAGIERTRSSDMNRIAMRESVAINSTISAVLQCLRSIKANQQTCPNAVKNSDSTLTPNRKKQLVPYRQNKLTMLMQPLFSGSINHDSDVHKTRTTVKLLVSVYPGMKDYNEKKSLLSEIEQFRGLSVEGTCVTQQTSKDSTITSFTQEDPVVDYYVNTEQTKDGEIPTSIESSRHNRDSSYPDRTVFRSAGQENMEPKFTVDCTRREKDPFVSSPSIESSNLRSPLQERNALNRLVEAVRPSSLKKRKTEKEELISLQDRVSQFEAENKLLNNKAEKRKRQCVSLKTENRNLKKRIEELDRREEELLIKLEQIPKDTSYDVHEESRKSSKLDLLKAREYRWKQQNLLGSPLTRHMNAVEGTKSIFTGLVGSQLMRRSPFKLTALMKTKDNPSTPMQQQDSNTMEHDLESLDYDDSASA